jgi:putative endonuclease
MKKGKTHLRTGRQGEELAAQYLLKKNYKIIKRNYRVRPGEIDIIAHKDDELVFVEVKTARSEAFGSPETWISRTKQQRLIRAAQLYLQQLCNHEVACRFDVITVRLQRPQAKIEHIKDAFWME